MSLKCHIYTKCANSMMQIIGVVCQYICHTQTHCHAWGGKKNCTQTMQPNSNYICCIWPFGQICQKPKQGILKNKAKLNHLHFKIPKQNIISLNMTKKHQFFHEESNVALLTKMRQNIPSLLWNTKIWHLKWESVITNLKAITYNKNPEGFELSSNMHMY